MTSPLLTVLVLAVLWLIVVVPMVVRRSDERAHDKSIRRFGRAMRAMGSRQIALARQSAPSRDLSQEDAPVVVPHVKGPRSEVFASRPAPSSRPVAAALANPARPAVPAPQEALMYPIDRSEMSEARRQMMVRRRRALAVQAGGLVLSSVLAAVMGGMFWALTGLFVLSLVGYVFFLRRQKLRDVARRSRRLERASQARHPSSYDVTASGPVDETVAPSAKSVVRIDDDDIELHALDTIDLTGLYSTSSPEALSPVAERRAS